MGRKPSFQLLADWVVSYISHHEWRTLKTTCYSSIKFFAKGCSDTWAQELVEENWMHVAEALRNRYAETISDGEFVSFEIDNEEDPYIRSLKGSKQKEIRGLQKVEPNKFEDICRHILDRLGGDARVIGGSGDGGIDFVSEGLCFTIENRLPIPSRSKCVIIGQAKRYKHGKYVTEKEMRDFVGAAILKIQDLRAGEKIFEFTPIVLAFWTSGDFHPEAKRYARRLGIWTMGGWTMLEYITAFSIKIE